MNLQARIPIDDLLAPGQEYSAAKLALYDALYAGGSKMETVKKTLLPVRRFETADGPVYRERLALAPYVRRVAGFIDWLRAAMFFREPFIVYHDGVDGEYWDALNTDADGQGISIAGQMRDTALECLKYQRCWLTVDFPASEARAIDPGSKDAKIRILGAEEVTDWKMRGRVLDWVRLHGIEPLRPEDEWKQPDRERHVWTFIDETASHLYEAIKRTKVDTKAEKGTTIDWLEEEKKARLIETRAHAMGIPVFACCYADGQWIMEGTFDVARAMFQCDANIENLRDKMSFRILRLILDRNELGELVLPDLSALHLRPGENADFIGPDASLLDPLFKDAEKLKRDLLECVHASANNAANIPQAGRLSGEAVEKMRDPLKVLLWSFAWPVLDVFNKTIKHIARLRGEDPDAVEIVGLDDYDVTMDDAEKEIMRNGQDKDGDGNGAEESGDHFGGSSDRGTSGRDDRIPGRQTA